MELGGFEPPTSWVIQGGRRAESRQNMPICRTFLMTLERLQKVRYAGICTDMRGSQALLQKSA